MKSMKFTAFGEILWDVFPDRAYLGGAALNFAAHCALLGVESRLISAVGKDELGERALRELADLGVKTDFVASLEEMETGACRVSLDNQGLPRYDLLRNVAYDAIPQPIGAPTSDLIYFGTLALREEHNRKTIQSLLKEHRGDVFADLNIRPPHYSEETVRFALENARIIKISDEEMPLVATCIFGKSTFPEEDLLRLAANFPRIEILLLTKGAKGSLALETKTGKIITCPAEKTTVKSTVGAGDSFSAAFLTSYLADRDISLALSRAARLSAYVVSHTEAVPRSIPSSLWE